MPPSLFLQVSISCDMITSVTSPSQRRRCLNPLAPQGHFFTRLHDVEVAVLSSTSQYACLKACPCGIRNLIGIVMAVISRAKYLGSGVMYKLQENMFVFPPTLVGVSRLVRRRSRHTCLLSLQADSAVEPRESKASDLLFSCS